MNNFHVGDRWADEDGDEWLVFATSDDRTTCRAVLLGEKFVNAEFRTDGKCITDGWTLFLTRLISSERWIPFAEMLPDSADDRPGQMLVVEYATNTPSLFISSEGDEGWFEWRERWGDNGYERLTPSDMRDIGGTHWRYLTPPEAS